MSVATFAVPADIPQNCEWTSAKATIRSSDTEREAGEQTAFVFSLGFRRIFFTSPPTPRHTPLTPTAISLDSLCFHMCAPAISKLQQLPPECEEGTYVLFFSHSFGEETQKGKKTKNCPREREGRRNMTGAAGFWFCGRKSGAGG